MVSELQDRDGPSSGSVLNSFSQRLASARKSSNMSNATPKSRARADSEQRYHATREKSLVQLSSYAQALRRHTAKFTHSERLTDAFRTPRLFDFEPSQHC